MQLIFTCKYWSSKIRAWMILKVNINKHFNGLVLVVEITFICKERHPCCTVSNRSYQGKLKFLLPMSWSEQDWHRKKKYSTHLGGLAPASNKEKHLISISVLSLGIFPFSVWYQKKNWKNSTLVKHWNSKQEKTHSCSWNWGGCSFQISLFMHLSCRRSLDLSCWYFFFFPPAFSSDVLNLCFHHCCLFIAWMFLWCYFWVIF